MSRPNWFSVPSQNNQKHFQQQSQFGEKFCLQNPERSFLKVFQSSRIKKLRFFIDLSFEFFTKLVFTSAPSNKKNDLNYKWYNKSKKLLFFGKIFQRCFFKLFEFSNYQTLIKAYINTSYKRNRNFQLRFWTKIKWKEKKPILSYPGLRYVHKKN